MGAHNRGLFPGFGEGQGEWRKASEEVKLNWDLKDE
jgi:hypothetical protein